MKKVLIATTNKDKYNVVSKIFKETIFPANEYEIQKLDDSMHLPDEKEYGTNVERARSKALNAFNHLKEYGFDYIVGLDDAIVIEGETQPNIKEYLNKVLYEDYIKDNELYAFNRAYAIIDKEQYLYETDISIPYIYHPLKENFTIEEHTYPLAHVAYTVDDNRSLCELSSEEETNYYLKYVKDKLMSLQINSKKH